MLPMMFLGLRKLGNICREHKMFLNKIRNFFCVPDTKFVSATNVTRGETGKHLCRQQCVRNNVSSFARALLLSQMLFQFNSCFAGVNFSCVSAHCPKFCPKFDRNEMKSVREWNVQNKTSEFFCKKCSLEN